MAETLCEQPHTYVGGCHCGAVLYQVQLEPASSQRWSSVWEHVANPSRFKLLSGEEQISGHQFEADPVHHFYCESCGARVYSHHVGARREGFYLIDLRSLHARAEHRARVHAR
jgi:hypothetical protein